MHVELDLPDLVRELAERVAAAGGRAYVVGGSVRDHLLGLPWKDWDIEVYALSLDALERVLRRLGDVHAVGRSFGVLKLTRGDLEVDVSIPRRDSKVGSGHRGIEVVGDPHLDVREASRRRDLTVNAMLVDPLTGELVDPWNGRSDLAAGVLRAVDADTFLEDPLRALRAVQFAARFELAPDPELVDLCARADLHELPAERVRDEWNKLLLRAPRPSVGLALARRTDVMRRVFPEVAANGAVDRAVDAAAAVRDTLEPEGRRLALMLGAWLHTTPPASVEAALDRLGLHRWGGYAVRSRLLAALEHLEHAIEDDAALRWLSTRAEVELTLRLREVAHGDVGDALLRARALGVLHDAPPPLLYGRDIAVLGFAPGPEMGAALDHVYAEQLDGTVSDREGALAAARRWRSRR